MTSLALAAPEPPTVDVAARTISGLAVPYGPVGQTSAGRLQFSAGALQLPAQTSRVKLLREHDQRDVVGFATELVETPAGLYATFSVPPGVEGDRALADAASFLRDALSVGVQLDDRSNELLRRANGAAVQGTGALREVSLVSVPAFDDARVDSVAARTADLTVSSWSYASSTSTTPPALTGDPTVPDQTAPPAPPVVVAAAPVVTAAAVVVPPPVVVPPAAPAPLAVAGAALVTGSPSTYTFGVDSASLVRDAYAARMNGDGEAGARVARFNAELTDGNPASVLAIAAVMQTTDPGAVGVIQPNVRRPDLLLSLIDIGRPITSRFVPIPIRNATPFLIPVEAEYDGIGLHVQGTAHVAEGTYSLGEVTVTPRALSGAFRVSREMVDSSNPAIDRLALAAMIRDYRRETEVRTLAELTLNAGAATLNTTTVSKLRAALLAFGDDTIVADFLATGRGFLQTVLLDVDSTGRPLLPYVGPTNASGQVRAGYTGFSVDGVDAVKATTLPAAEAMIVDADSVMVAESGAQTFRFDEVEGPGIIKLALFGYFAVKALRVGAVKRLTTAAV